MKFFTILFVILLIGAVITNCFAGYAPFLGKLSTALMWLTIGVGVVMAVFIGLKIYKDIKGKRD